MAVDRSKTVCFTGHRPEKLPGGGAERSPVVRMIKSRLYLEIETAAKEGYDTFITGMQRGVDLWAGECVLELMNIYDLRLIAAIPYKEFGVSYKDKDKWLFGRIKDAASEVIYIDDLYTRECYKHRNEFMVENSSLLIAVVDDLNSGTGQTIGLARKSGLIIRTVTVEHPYETDHEEAQLRLLDM